MEYEVKHDEAARRFYVETDGETGYAEYVVKDGALDVIHTIVPKAIGGRGIAAAVVEAAYRYARRAGLRPEATCPYAAVWLQRHPFETL